jgi:hypothetical protein
LFGKPYGTIISLLDASDGDLHSSSTTISSDLHAFRLGFARAFNPQPAQGLRIPDRQKADAAG